MGDEESFFRIEKVLKKKDGKVLVSWKGWPSKYDRWVSEAQFEKEVGYLSYRDLQLQNVFIKNASSLLLLNNRAALSNTLLSSKLFTPAFAEDINNFT